MSRLETTYLKGLEAGRAEGKIEIAKNLIAMKLESIEQIAQASGLSVEEVSNLRGKTEQAQNAKKSFHAMWWKSIFWNLSVNFLTMPFRAIVKL